MWVYNIINDNLGIQMKILISTQIYENYGTESDPYWKAKGGDDYFIENFNGSETDATKLVMAIRDQVEMNNPLYQETITGFDIVPDDYITQYERNQLEYEGEIVHPVKILEIA